MIFYSTKSKKNQISFREAVVRGIAEDGGLYVPAQYPELSPAFISALADSTMAEIGFTVIREYCDDIPDQELHSILEETLTFDFPLVPLSDNISILELFHGPTLAFKDLGARFLANLLSYYLRQRDKEILVLVATSGDTGSAVAHGFYNMAGIKVGLLYPSRKVSHIQEQQLTTLDRNIYALEIDGTFDDCQDMVKKAFQDRELQKKFYLTSANSINIARLLPQSFYYFYAYGQLIRRHSRRSSTEVIFSVPCGNFGNLTAGLIAAKMGLPVEIFIAAVNSNTIFPEYLASGDFKPRPAIKTLSNAMDVGNPSNVQRILSLYGNKLTAMNEKVYSCSISDPETIAGIQEVHAKYGYVIDPHGAVGYQALNRFQRQYNDTKKDQPVHFITLETAHPAKFLDIVAAVLNIEIEMPARLAEVMHKQKKSIFVKNDFDILKSHLMELP
jgi:threonine synthase